jgi:5-methylcytosine-specific restriction endonuclease McrA
MTEDWTRRETPEWIGKTPDSKVPDHVRQRVFLRHKGMCHIAKRKIRAAEPWELEHVIALRDWTKEGHGNRESNLAPALKDKHREKTTAEASDRAITDRIAKKHAGIKPERRAFPRHVDPWGKNWVRR